MNVYAPSTNAFEDATIEATRDPSKEMRPLVGRVRESGVKVALLSNMYLFEVMKTKQSSRYDGFDYVAFSAEEGMTKENPELFVQTLKYFDIPQEETLFADDIPAYTAVAASLGIHTITADRGSFASAAELARAVYSELGFGSIEA